MIKKVIVVGAGLSGLSAAYELQNLTHTLEKVEIVILEGRNRIGGRIFTKKDPSFGYIDAGASHVGPTQVRILRVAKELGVETFKTHQSGSTLFNSMGQTCSFNGVLPYWNPLNWLDCNNLMRKINELSKQVSPDAPWKATKAEEWDNKTMMQFINELCWTSAGREWGRMFVRTNMAAEPEEVSLLFVLWRVRQAGGLVRLREISAGGRKFVGGAQLICQKLAKQLRASATAMLQGADLIGSTLSVHYNLHSPL